MIEDFEIGVYIYQIIQKDSRLGFRVFRRGTSLQMNWLYLDDVMFQSIKENRIQFSKGIFTYIISFTEYVPGIYKTHFTAKLFHWLPYYRYRGEIGSKNKSDLYAHFCKYS